ncbi:hypothetical protein D3C78_1080150 [compost metagenome]
MACGNGIQPLGRRNHQQFQRAQIAARAHFGRYQGQGFVDALGAFHVQVQGIQKDVRQGVSGDLRQRRVGGGHGGRGAFLRAVHAPGANHQYPVGAQVDGRRQRRGLAHGAVAEIFDMRADVQRCGGKDEGNRRRREQVGMADVAADRASLGAYPGLQMGMGFVEAHMFARAVARGGDGQRAQMALGDQPGQARQRHQIALQQRGQRRVVQQGARAHGAPAGQGPAQRQQAQPARAAAQHAQRIGVVDAVGVQMAPGAGDLPHGVVEMVGAAGQGGGIDGAGRRARENGKGVGPMALAAVAPDLGNGFEHADLVGGAGAAAGEQQAHGRGDDGQGRSGQGAAVGRGRESVGHGRHQCAVGG